MAETMHPVRRGGLEDLPRVESLWLAMAAHHWHVMGEAWPPREAEDSWRRRRAAYAGWLESGEGRLLLADGEPEADDGAPPVGYAFLRVRTGGATFDLGERIGELESLSVAPEVRGRGVGGALIEAARALLREEGVTHWTVAYYETNLDAGRLYERAGFRPFNRQLMGRVER